MGFDRQQRADGEHPELQGDPVNDDAEIDAMVEQISSMLADKSNDFRSSVFTRLSNKFCLECGTTYLPCHCMRDD